MLNMPAHVRAQIEALKAEAEASGDELQADLCRQAIAGNHTAWMLCVKVILDARAQVDAA